MATINFDAFGISSDSIGDFTHQSFKLPSVDDGGSSGGSVVDSCSSRDCRTSKKADIGGFGDVPKNDFFITGEQFGGSINENIQKDIQTSQAGFIGDSEISTFIFTFAIVLVAGYVGYQNS